MNKKLMKIRNLKLLLIGLCILLVSGCGNDLEKRVSDLEEKVNDGGEYNYCVEWEMFNETYNLLEVLLMEFSMRKALNMSNLSLLPFMDNCSKYLKSKDVR